MITPKFKVPSGSWIAGNFCLDVWFGKTQAAFASSDPPQRTFHRGCRNGTFRQQSRWSQKPGTWYRERTSPHQPWRRQRAANQELRSRGRPTVIAGEINDPARQRRRRSHRTFGSKLALERAGLLVDGVEILVHATDIDQPILKGGRRNDAPVGLKFPFDAGEHRDACSGVHARPEA